MICFLTFSRRIERITGRPFSESCGHLISAGFRKPSDADSARPVSGIRLRRPSHAPAAVAHVVRPWREGRQLVYVVLQRPKTTSPHSDVQFDAIGSRLWSITRFGPWTDFVSPLPADLLQLVKRHHLTPHVYADDTQIYGHCQSSDAGGLTLSLSVS